MTYWFYLNLLTLIFAIFQFLMGLPKIGIIFFASFFGLIGLIFILFNWNMHAIFSKIRQLNNRNDRIKIAKYARKIMPYHLLIGIVGLTFICVHLFIFLINYGLLFNLKFLSGFAAFIALIIVSISGYLRKVKASRLRRLTHLYSSFILFVLTLIHLVL